MAADGSLFWSLPRIGGAVIVGTALILVLVGVALVVVGGDLRAAEAMFRDIEAAVGHTPTLRMMSVSLGVWSIAVLAGFTVLAVELWSREVRVVPALALTGLLLFAIAGIIEGAFHSSVTVWAVGQLEQGGDVPALFDQLKLWFNVWVQILVNPLALLSMLGLAVVCAQQEIVPSWAGWAIAVWCGAFVFFPLPLAIAPAALFFGAVLLLTG